MITSSNTLLGNRLCDNAPPRVTSDCVLRYKDSSDSRIFGITSEQLSTHVLHIGGTGSGKTNAMLLTIDQIKKSLTKDDVMLIFDSKLDFARFHSPNDVIISNRRRSNITNEGWNIFRDIVADGWDKESIDLNTEELASTIFSDAIEQSSQPFFPTAARDIFAAVLKAMCCIGINDVTHRIKYMNNAALKKYLLNLNAKKLHTFLAKTEFAGVLKYVGNGQSDQALGVFAELEQATGRLFNRCFGNADGRFSIRRFVKQRGRKTLFIEYDPSSGASFQPIYRALVDLFLKEALSSEAPKGKIYIVCDELKMIPRLQHFENALNFGRSLGITVLCSVQSLEQLFELYGEYGGKNIASAFQNTLVFRTNNAASRDYVKGIHGESYTAIQYLDPSKKPDSTLREGHCVEDWDILSLRKGEAIIGLSGEKPFKFYFERYR